MPYSAQGWIQDFRFNGVEGTNWHARCGAILATPIFVAEERSFPPFSSLYLSEWLRPRQWLQAILDYISEGSVSHIKCVVCSLH